MAETCCPLGRVWAGEGRVNSSFPVLALVELQCSRGWPAGANEVWAALLHCLLPPPLASGCPAPHLPAATGHCTPVCYLWRPPHLSAATGHRTPVCYHACATPASSHSQLPAGPFLVTQELHNRGLLGQPATVANISSGVSREARERGGCTRLLPPMLCLLSMLPLPAASQEPC